jgi:type IV secretion system protein TrbL
MVGSYTNDEASLMTLVGLSLVCAYLTKTIPELIGMISGVDGRRLCNWGMAAAGAAGAAAAVATVATAGQQPAAGALGAAGTGGGAASAAVVDWPPH